jgi:hypothetical protein
LSGRGKKPGRYILLLLLLLLLLMMMMMVLISVRRVLKKIVSR